MYAICEFHLAKFGFVIGTTSLTLKSASHGSNVSSYSGLPTEASQYCFVQYSHYQFTCLSIGNVGPINVTDRPLQSSWSASELRISGSVGRAMNKRVLTDFLVWPYATVSVGERSEICVAFCMSRLSQYTRKSLEMVKAYQWGLVFSRLVSKPARLEIAGLMVVTAWRWSRKATHRIINDLFDKNVLDRTLFIHLIPHTNVHIWAHPDSANSMGLSSPPA